jgi:hypothetical protein
VLVYVWNPVASGLYQKRRKADSKRNRLSMRASERTQNLIEVLKQITPSLARLTVLMDSSRLMQNAWQF